MVGGSGDDRNHFEPLYPDIKAAFPNLNIISFSFRGYESKTIFPAHQQVVDLKEVIDVATTKYNFKDIYIACTSYGAFSTAIVLTSSPQSKLIKYSLFIDPADYYLDPDTEGEPDTWDGDKIYTPSRPTISSQLKNINTQVSIDVIHFSLKNYRPGGWGNTPYKRRGVDDPTLYTRLNSDMVRSFYTNTPTKNQGKYLEINGLPHAFMRDGNIPQNIVKISKLIIDCLTNQI